jgi:hypothetical protein
MKTLKAICTAAILALALSVPAYAGDMHTPGAPSPGDVSTPGKTVVTPTDSGDIGSPGFADILWALASMF